LRADTKINSNPPIILSQVPPDLIEFVKLIGLPVALCLGGIKWLANFANVLAKSNKDLLSELHAERQSQITKLQSESEECRRDRESLRKELREKWEQMIDLMRQKGL
jgi:hypothetical protein